MEEINLKEALVDYLKYVKLKDKPQSYNKIKSRINLYIIPYFDLNLNIENITTKDYLDYQNKINNLNISYKYKKIIHYTNVALFNYCIKYYNLSKNVASIVGNFKNNEIKKEVKIWNNKEFKKFINAIDKNDYIYKILFKFMFYTGCRLGECLALTWDDIQDNKIIINKTITKENINGKRLISTPKTLTSNRNINIDIFLKYDLKRLKRYYEHIYQNFNTNNFVFGYNKPLAPTTIERKKNKYCKLANVKQIRLHDFRHSHSSILLSKGVPVQIVSNRLGHSDIAMTLNTYTHIFDKDKKRVLKTLSLMHIF